MGRYRILKLAVNKGENLSILSSKPRNPKHGQVSEGKEFKKADKLDKVDLKYLK